MPVHDSLFALVDPQGILAYIGPGLGGEFLPYAVALLAVMATALIAVVQMPIVWMLQVLRKVRGALKDHTGTLQAPQPTGEVRPGDERERPPALSSQVLPPDPPTSAASSSR